MLAYSDRDRREVLAVLPPRRGEATVEAVAINAVLAGCEPRQLPLLIAAVRGIAEPEFNLSGINATTHPCAVLILVNGPIGRELGVHGGPGCYGPGFRANATIGRAMRLLLLNVAGASPGLGDRATQGTPAKFALCLAEHEEASPWAPFQTTRGFAPEDSTVTVAACEGPHNIQEHGSNTALGVLQTVAGALGQAGSNNILSRGEPLLALGPEHAATIAAEGWTREGVQEYLHEHARYPAARLSPEFLEAVNVRIEPGVWTGSVPRGRAAPDRQQPRAAAHLRGWRARQALLVAADLWAADRARDDRDRGPPRPPAAQRRGASRLVAARYEQVAMSGQFSGIPFGKRAFQGALTACTFEAGMKGMKTPPEIAQKRILVSSQPVAAAAATSWSLSPPLKTMNPKPSSCGISPFTMLAVAAGAS